MLYRILCAGMGGQGVLTLGMILAEASAAQDKYVTWVPAYGSEMRGGDASCQLKISDEAIGNPYAQEVDILVALTEKAVNDHISKVEDDGLLIVNSSIVKNLPQDIKCKVIGIPANEIAIREENPKGVGVTIVGGIIASTGIMPYDLTKDAIRAYFEHKGIPTEPNEKVFTAGYEFVKETVN